MAKNIKAFISGKVTGLSLEEAISNFDKLAKLLRNAGYEVKNPMERLLQINAGRALDGLPPLTDATHRKEIMGICLFDLSQCDEIHFLPNHQGSQGSKLELYFAEKMHITRCFHPFLEDEYELMLQEKSLKSV